MHILGLGGHMRRIYDPTQYVHLQHLQPMNVFITISAFLLGVSQIVLIINLLKSLFWGEKVGPNPWEANTLEWTAPSPPPHGNFETMPTVYRGPYEYSEPGRATDWHPQNEPG